MSVLKSLLPHTESVLIEISDKPFLEKFTFVGGSAISIYLNHRKSEDLDFFSWEKNIDIDNIISELDTNTLTVLNRSEIQLDLLYKGVKITFFANGWKEITKRLPLIKNVYISPLEVLAVMKVNTMFLRAKYRDYYDLYTICKEKFSVMELYNMSEPLIPNLNIRLFQTALVFTDDITDDNILHLLPRLQISKKEIADFFIKEIKKWNKSISHKL